MDRLIPQPFRMERVVSQYEASYGIAKNPVVASPT